MASWLDIISFILTAGLLVGFVVGVVYAGNAISQAMQSTKESLKAKGVDISKSGMSVKTSGRYTREDYIDATQRGLIKSMGAASFGPQGPDGASGPSNGHVHNTAPPAMERRNSNASIKSIGSTHSGGEKEKKKHLFGLRKTYSGTSK